jgi:hypothetical protein
MKKLSHRQLIHGNWLGKSYFETWPEFLSRHIRSTTCKVFGHSRRVILKMDAPKGICARCRIVL